MHNFISEHLVKKIQEIVRQKTEVLKHDGFCYFNDPIKDGDVAINRVNKWSLYQSEKVIPTNWYKISGSVLAIAYLKLKANDFYIYKDMSGTYCKVRLKKGLNNIVKQD